MSDPYPPFVVFSLVGVGVGIAAVMARKARRPRATFVRTAVALTALSFVRISPSGSALAPPPP